MSLTNDARQDLLSDLSQMGSSGRAESENSQTFKRTYLPVQEHVRAFDPSVALVLGVRGAGKSELFRAAVQENLLPAIVRTTREAHNLDRIVDKTEWLTGHPLGKDFPDDVEMRRFFDSQPLKAEAERDLWFAYLVRTVRDHLKASPINDSEMLKLRGAEIGKVVDAFRSLGDKPLLALDDLDRKLETEDRWLLVSYDELDIIGGYDWDSMIASIRGLVGFWSNYSRRWTRIRPKIFLRTDLFRRHGQSFGADLIKLAANRTEINWSDRNLYTMLIKRIANASSRLADYCRQSRVTFDEDPDLGLIPRLQKDTDAKPLIEKIAGQFMGANLKKGRTFPWLLTHVRDGNGHAIPRALVRLIEEAATQESARPLANYNRLLDPRSIRRALDVVSREYVLQVNTHELPWLPGVEERLKEHGVPMDRRQIENLLNKKWDQPWSKDQPKVRPPAENASQLTDLLLEIGVFGSRPHNRLDVPDLFLAGLGLTRKGGVKKR
jgi:hypothetical protein